MYGLYQEESSRNALSQLRIFRWFEGSYPRPFQKKIWRYGLLQFGLFGMLATALFMMEPNPTPLILLTEAWVSSMSTTQRFRQLHPCCNVGLMILFLYLNKPCSLVSVVSVLLWLCASACPHFWPLVFVGALLSVWCLVMGLTTSGFYFVICVIINKIFLST